MTILEFGQLEENIGQVRSGIIGDWHVKRCDSTEIRLIVNPGYGASKKTSFVQPDVSAILKYELVLRPLEPVVLTVNDLRVPHSFVEPIFKKEADSGIYGLLYNLLTLRPCFGNFQPELVETLKNAKGSSTSKTSRSRTCSSTPTSSGPAKTAGPTPAQSGPKSAPFWPKARSATCVLPALISNAPWSSTGPC